MRMLALGQAWQSIGGRVVFACATLTPALERRLGESGFEMHRLNAGPGTGDDLWQTKELLGEIHKAHSYKIPMALDGYHFDTDYETGLKQAGGALLVLEDYLDSDHRRADILLNQNFSPPSPDHRKVAPKTKVLLGPRFALLRQEFLQYREWERDISPIGRRILVTLGGADVENITERVISAVAEGPYHLRIVIGGSNPNMERMQTAVRALAKESAQIELIHDADNMPELMAWADLAVTAGGSTLLESALIGLPSIVLVLAPNQEASSSAMAAHGACHNLGDAKKISGDEIAHAVRHLAEDSAGRKRMTSAGRACVDGLGAKRVAANLLAAIVRIRPAQEGDCRLLWEWVNDPVAREMSFSKAPIPWYEHVAWWQTMRKDPSRFLYIAESPEGQPLGKVRFDQKGDEAVVSIAISSENRGCGWGAAVLIKACDKFFEASQCKTITAQIKAGNRPSISVFDVANFNFAKNSLQVAEYGATCFFSRNQPGIAR